jgi:hypothetical protein
MENFTLWLEFEHVEGLDPENDFCNIHVDLPDGRHYEMNVWTYKFLETTIDTAKTSGGNLKGLYVTPPDLLVKELTRDCIERTIADLIKQGDLENMLNPGVVSESGKKE